MYMSVFFKARAGTCRKSEHGEQHRGIFIPNFRVVMEFSLLIDMRNRSQALLKSGVTENGFSAQTLFNRQRIREGRFNPDMKSSSGSELRFAKAFFGLEPQC